MSDEYPVYHCTNYARKLILNGTSLIRFADSAADDLMANI
jgi:hypothetical protein